jgi:hypothetical protein
MMTAATAIARKPSSAGKYDPPVLAAGGDKTRLPRWLVISLISLAGLLLEVGYTRIVSYKLWYYYTYLVIGLALLGIGSGGVLVSVSERLRRLATDRLVGWFAIGGAATIAAGYLVIAWTHVNTLAIWDYGTRSSFKNLFLLGLICFALFASFIAFGVIVAALLGRAGNDVPRLYFADLVGAGLGCVLAIPLITRLGPPGVVVLAAVVFAIVGIASLVRMRIALALGAIVIVLAAATGGALPGIHTEDTKQHAPVAVASEWGPVFRVDAVKIPNNSSSYLLEHDGTFGSAIMKWNGDPSTLSYFARDSRSIPFRVRQTPPSDELIIGSAGGREILTSIYYKSPQIQAVELNPVTVGLLRHKLADYSGHVATYPGVHMHQGDGRTYLARHDDKYGLIWYVAPDSYAANNAVSSGAFVLSESYLYTTEMIKQSLQHLADDGLIVVQFGEFDFAHAPNRTSRYVVTARKALSELGVKDPSQHLLVSFDTKSNLSTIIVKRTPLTGGEISGFVHGVPAIPGSKVIYAPGQPLANGIVSQLAGGSNAQVHSLVAHSPKAIGPISDDSPYFWHFSRFSNVFAHIFQPLKTNDPENVIGERVLFLLLFIATAYAAIFLLAPFVFVRKQWRALPAKGRSAVYFAALGLGFMFFEITMIQRLVLFLGYPTYSLTVTLATLLVSTGLGALLSRRVSNPNRAMPWLFGALVVLTLFYEFALDDILRGSLLSTSLGVRVLFAVAVMTPLGLCLGMFMPFGLLRVGSLTDHGDQYVAWSWAVNGFFAVIGSVLTTMLSMTYGFHAVQLGALVIYAVAAFMFGRLPAAAPALALDAIDQGDDADRGEHGERGLGGGAEASLPIGGG